MTTPTLALPAPTPARRPLIAFPLVLIALGLVFLLANAGYVGEGEIGYAGENCAARASPFCRSERRSDSSVRTW